MSNPTQYPTPKPTNPPKPLPAFKSLSFDIYETLIEWEPSILTHLTQLLDHLPPNNPYNNINTNKQTLKKKLTTQFAKHEATLQTSTPNSKYSSILEQAYLNLATDVLPTPRTHETEKLLKKEAKDFGDSIGEWPAYPDTIEAMKRLSKYYKIIALSNVDSSSFSRTLSGPLQNEVGFWKVYTAEEIGTYKPCLRNFEVLIDGVEGEEGFGKEVHLHVAQSLWHDHGPCKKIGLDSVWISRRGAGTGSGSSSGSGSGSVGLEMIERGDVGFGWRFDTLGEFADEVERQWGLLDDKGMKERREMH